MDIFNLLLIAWVFIGFLAFLFLLYKPAPYGRHIERGWGIEISARKGWIFMESPVFFLMPLYFFLAGDLDNKVQIILTILICLHYLNRSFIWPIRSESLKKNIPLSVVFSAFFFNIFNAIFQGTSLFVFIQYPNNWIYSVPFICGFILFIVGFFINFKSDEIIIQLKKEKGEGYFIPKGFLYSRISCPNYLGEFIEWLGWALMTYSLAGFVFFLWTLFNLVPRAISNHKWNLENIDEYPKDRKAVLPYLI